MESSSLNLFIFLQCLFYYQYTIWLTKLGDILCSFLLFVIPFGLITTYWVCFLVSSLFVFFFLSLTSHPHESTRGQTMLRFEFQRRVGRLSLVRKLKLCAPPSLCQNSGAGCASSQLKNGTLVSIQPLFLMCLSSIKVVIAGQALNMPGFLTPILSVHPSPVKNLPCAPHLTQPHSDMLIQLLFSLMRHSRATK